MKTPTLPHPTPAARLYATTPIQNELNRLWNEQVDMRSCIRDEDRPSTEEKPFQDALNHKRRAIESMASDFLAAHGFTTTGRARK